MRGVKVGKVGEKYQKKLGKCEQRKLGQEEMGKWGEAEKVGNMRGNQEGEMM